MNFLKKFFSKKDQTNVGGIEDYMMLIGVYYEAAIAAYVGINNFAVFPKLKIFKQKYHVTTLNNKIGLAEKKHCQKILQSIYNLSDNFFQEIDNSIKKKCRTAQDVQPFLFQFQGMTQELTMLMSNMIGKRLGLINLFSKAVRSLIEKKVHEIMTRNDWSDEAIRRSCVTLRKYHANLLYSEGWMTEFVYICTKLAAKEKAPKK